MKQNIERICAQCGQSEKWCSVYTSCPLAKGNSHRIYEKVVDKRKDS